MCGKNTDLMCVIIFLFLIRPLVTPGIDTINEGVQKVFGTLDLFVSLLETEIKYPILQGGILPFWTPSSAVFISQGIGSCRDRFSAPASGMTFCPWRSCP